MCGCEKRIGFSFHPSTHIIASWMENFPEEVLLKKKPQTAA